MITAYRSTRLPPCVALGLALLVVFNSQMPVAWSDNRPAKLDEAKTRFRHAVELYNDRDFDGALLEFQQAYDLAPNFRILFNLGQVSYQRNDWVNALAFFSAYLKEGGDQIPAPRRAEVEAIVAKLPSRVGQVTIDVDTPGAEIMVDGDPVGTAPLAQPVRLNMGRRRVQAALPGGNPITKVVEVSGGDQVVVHFDLARRRLAQVAPSPGADLEATTAPRDSVRGGHAPWWAWGATAVLAGAGAYAATRAKQESNDLQGLRNSFPVTASALSDQQQRTNRAALLADGLMGAAGLMAALSLYMTLDSARPSRASARSTETITKFAVTPIIGTTPFAGAMVDLARTF